MDIFAQFWEKIRKSPSVLYPTFKIDSSRVLDEVGSNDEVFKANEAYFEIRIKEQFLQNKREYWNEYNPLTIAMTEFIYANKKESFPFVVGPDLLKKLEQMKGTEGVRYTNTRVVGPTPYRGDQIAIFIGLFRLKTKDWALQSINLLEKVAGAFDSSKLTGYLNIAKPLMEGIEGFLGMGEQMQFRIGQRSEYSDPETSSSNFFAPGYWVMIRQDANQINKSDFWVQDNQLFYGSDKGNLKPYLGSDYILYSVDKLTKRNDFITFDFHQKWLETKKSIWAGNEKGAVDSYQILISNLRESNDLIDSHINQLMAMYTSDFKKEKQIYEQTKNPTKIADVGNKILGIDKSTFENLNISEEGKKVLLATDEFFSFSISNKPIFDLSKADNESYIESVLESGYLNSSIIKNADPALLAASGSAAILSETSVK